MTYLLNRCNFMYQKFELCVATTLNKIISHNIKSTFNLPNTIYKSPHFLPPHL